MPVVILGSEDLGKALVDLGLAGENQVKARGAARDEMVQVVSLKMVGLCRREHGGWVRTVTWWAGNHFEMS